MKQYYDSTYSILKDINIALGGVDKDFYSCYSILLSILNILGGGGKEEVIVELPAILDETTMIATFKEESYNEETKTVIITNFE